MRKSTSKMLVLVIIALFILPMLNFSIMPVHAAETYSFLSKWGSAGSGDGQFQDPHGVAVDGSGNVYVADTQNHRVQKFTSDGVFVTKWGNVGSGDGQFSWHYGVAVDGSGSVYVLDTNNQRVQKFTTQLGFSLTVNKVGSGSVTKSPDQVTYDFGSKVYLTASADGGWSFSGWSANVVSDVGGSYVLFGGNNVAVTATFTQAAPIIYSVTPIMPAQSQVIHIYGEGFTDIFPQTVNLGDGSVDTVQSSTTQSMYIFDQGAGTHFWTAGMWAPWYDLIGIFLISWSDNEIVLGGFGSRLGTNENLGWNIATGDPIIIHINTPNGNCEFVLTVGMADTVPPVSEVAVDPLPEDSGWSGSDVIITISASDVGVGLDYIRYSLDGENWNLYSGPFTVSTEGINELLFRSVDKAGNVEQERSLVIKIDKTAPVTACVLEGVIGDQGWYVSDVLVTLTATDTYSGVLKTEYSFDGTTWTDYTEPFYVTKEGVNTLYYRSVDKAGKIEGFITIPAVKIDMTPPTTEQIVTSTPSGGSLVSFSSGDGGSTQYSINGGSPSSYTEPIAFEEDGVYIVSYCSVDSAGNIEEAKTIVITVDKTPPIITGRALTAPNANGWYRGDVTIHFEASDTVSGVATITPDFTITYEGSNLYVTGTAVDNAGNSASFTVSGINIDKTPPVIIGVTTTAPNANGWYKTPVTVHFTASDALSGIDSVTSDVVLETDVENGEVPGTARDSAGNSATYKVTGINIDRTPPKITLLIMNLEPVKLGNAVEAHANYIESHTDYALFEWGDGSSPTHIDLRTIADGTVKCLHTYAEPGVYVTSVTLIDLAGNSDLYRSMSFVVVYDPSGGFVTGGGWINSPAGAYTANPTLAGKATFGFVSKYLKGANVPTGNTEFQFQVAGMNFKSSSYDWLVVAGNKAQYKGTGTINGVGYYGFMLTATDGTKGSDMFRIKIWDKATSNIIYDNQLGAPETNDPTTAIAGGSIVVHSQYAKAEIASPFNVNIAGVVTFFQLMTLLTASLFIGGKTLKKSRFSFKLQ